MSCIYWTLLNSSLSTSSDVANIGNFMHQKLPSFATVHILPLSNFLLPGVQTVARGKVDALQPKELETYVISCLAPR
jgi:hypothetical protein